MRILGVLLFLLPALAPAAIINNGDFATGDLTGWSLYTTANGNYGAATGNGVVINYQTLAGITSYAAQLNVGTTSQPLPGGGVRQTVSLTPGDYVLTVDLAVENTYALPNSGAGTFQFYLADILVASHPFGAIAGSQTLRAALSIPFTITTAGDYSVSFEFIRTYVSNGDRTPKQYIDNILIVPAAAVPEPGTTALAGLGLAALGWFGLRRRQRS